MIDISDLTIDRIAHQTSNICRFGGRYNWFSVSEHLCICFDIYKEMAGEKCCRDELRYIMSHDWCEAIFGDIVKPVKDEVRIKHKGYWTSLCKFEEDINKDICKGVWSDYKEWDYDWDYKEIDNMALYVEMAYHSDEDHRHLEETINNALLETSVRGHGWAPKQAKIEFLRRFEEIK